MLASLTYKLNQALSELGDQVLVEDSNGKVKAHPAIKIAQDLTALRLSAASKLGFNSNTKRNVVTGATHGSVAEPVMPNIDPNDPKIKELRASAQAMIARRKQENSKL